LSRVKDIIDQEIEDEEINIEEFATIAIHR
jgi:hypothetical protein